MAGWRRSHETLSVGFSSVFELIAPDDDQTTNFSFGDNGSIQVNNERININAGDNVNLNLNGHNF